MRILAFKIIHDKDYRRYLGVKGGFIVDGVWALANLVLGVLNTSIWFVTLGVYYMVFGVMRLLLLSHLRRPCDSKDYNPRKIERICGVLLLASVFALSGIVTLVMTHLGGFDYNEILIYAMSTFAFYSLISSIVSYAKLRKCDDIIAITNARVNLAIALVSIFAIEIAMLTAFGKPEDAYLKFIMPILTGTGIAVTIGFLGVRSILGFSSQSN